MYQFIKTGVYALSACGILTLASCSNVADEPNQAPQQINERDFVSVPIEAKVELDESARSLVHTLSSNGSFQYKLNDGNIQLFTVIRNSDPSKPMYSAMLDWKIDAKTNTLLLNQEITLDWQLEQAMEQGEWYASCALTNTFHLDFASMGNFNFYNGPNTSSQKFSYDLVYEGYYASNRTEEQRRFVKPILYARTPITGTDYYASGDGAYAPTNKLDYEGASIPSGTQTASLPALYIMPWTKVAITGKKYVNMSNEARSISYTETSDRRKRIAFSGRLKPIGTVVRVKIETEPATYEMLDKSQSTDDLKKYVNYAPWYIDKIRIKGQPDGNYDFASGTVQAGQLPTFKSSQTSDKEFLLGLSNYTIPSFNSPKQDLGYFYYWTPEETLKVSIDLEHPYRLQPYTGLLTVIKEKNGTLTKYQYADPNDYRLHTETVDRYMRYPAGTNNFNLEYSNDYYYIDDPNITQVMLPVYPSKTKTSAADTEWQSLFNYSPYVFDATVSYPMKTISLKGGYTKTVTLKVKPSIKNARRVQPKKFTSTYVGA